MEKLYDAGDLFNIPLLEATDFSEFLKDKNRTAINNAYRRNDMPISDFESIANNKERLSRDRLIRELSKKQLASGSEPVEKRRAGDYTQEELDSVNDNTAKSLKFFVAGTEAKTAAIEKETKEAEEELKKAEEELRSQLWLPKARSLSIEIKRNITEYKKEKDESKKAELEERIDTQYLNFTEMLDNDDLEKITHNSSYEEALIASSKLKGIQQIEYLVDEFSRIFSTSEIQARVEEARDRLEKSKSSLSKLKTKKREHAEAYLTDEIKVEKRRDDMLQAGRIRAEKSNADALANKLIITEMNPINPNAEKLQFRAERVQKSSVIDDMVKLFGRHIANLIKTQGLSDVKGNMTEVKRVIQERENLTQRQKDQLTFRIDQYSNLQYLKNEFNKLYLDYKKAQESLNNRKDYESDPVANRKRIQELVDKGVLSANALEMSGNQKKNSILFDENEAKGIIAKMDNIITQFKKVISKVNYMGAVSRNVYDDLLSELNAARIAEEEAHEFYKNKWNKNTTSETNKRRIKDIALEQIQNRIQTEDWWPENYFTAKADPLPKISPKIQ